MNKPSLPLDSTSLTADILNRSLQANCGAIRFESGEGGLIYATLTHETGHTAQVYLSGAQVVSWKTPNGEDLLYLSPIVSFAAGKTIRGGIPIIFPQFGPGVLPAHGFARTSIWQVSAADVTSSGDVRLELSLDHKMAPWNKNLYRLQLSITLNTKLVLELTTHNLQTTPLPIQNGLHTYFAIGALAETTVHGLQGLSYIDKVRQDQRYSEQRDSITITEETDRIYHKVSSTLTIKDKANRRSIKVQSSGFNDAVLWNPWIEKSKRLSDFPPEDYKRMLCLEATNAVSHVVVAANDSVTSSQTLSYTA